MKFPVVIAVLAFTSASCAGRGQPPTVMAAVQEPPGPCEDPVYLRIKPIPLAKMSDREYQYFLTTVEKLGAQEFEDFLMRDRACAAHERRRAEESVKPPLKRTPTRAWLIGVPVLAVLVAMASASTQ